MTSCCTIQVVWIYRLTLSCMIQFKRSTTYEAFLCIVVYCYITFLNAAIWAKAQLFYYSTWKFLFSHHHSFVCKALLNPSFLTCPFDVMFRCFYTWIFAPLLCRPPILEVQKVQCFPATLLSLENVLNIQFDNWALSKFKITKFDFLYICSIISFSLKIFSIFQKL